MTIKNRPHRSLSKYELPFFLDLSRSLHTSLSINNLIINIIDKIRNIMDVEAVSVILHDKKTNELVFCWSSDKPERKERLKKIRFPVDQGIAGSVYKYGEPEIIMDVVNDSRHFKFVDKTIKHDTKSMIAVPLKTAERTIGVIEAINKTVGNFDHNDLDFLITLAPIIAMALENARMYEKLKTAHQELKRIDRGKDDLIRQALDQVDLLSHEVKKNNRFDQIIGSSEPMTQIFRLCEKVITSDITVLIEGGSGTGKEILAKCIHFNGYRGTKPFVSQNCGGIPDTLLSSELFGHKRGAFTGAVRDKKGIFEAANGGTIFLDEVGETSSAMQTSLLRVLQEGEIKPLGAVKTKKVDVRVISATNRNLGESVKKGTFREDLYYRLNVFPIRLPNLRDRTGDVPLLARFFIKKHSKKINKSPKDISQEALECLDNYPFPGNVRELENEIERAIAMAGGDKFIWPCHLSEKIRSHKNQFNYKLQREGTLKNMVEKLERSALAEALKRHGGNKTRAAKELGLSRYGLHKMVQRYDL